MFHKLEIYQWMVENGIFYFSNDVFNRPFSQGCQNLGLLGKGLIHFNT